MLSPLHVFGSVVLLLIIPHNVSTFFDATDQHNLNKISFNKDS